MFWKRFVLSTAMDFMTGQAHRVPKAVVSLVMMHDPVQLLERRRYVPRQVKAAHRMQFGAISSSRAAALSSATRVGRMPMPRPFCSKALD